MISDLPFSSLHDLLEVAFPVHTFPAKYEYLNVLDQNADCRDTIADVLSGLHKEFNIGESKRHLVVTGDAKTYQHLQSIKLDYGEELSWLIPFPGDFHILMNYQPILSKVYLKPGLKQIAGASGFRAETLPYKCVFTSNTPTTSIWKLGRPCTCTWWRVLCLKAQMQQSFCSILQPQ